MIWSIIIGGFIGFIAGAITKKGGAMGIIANIVAGLIWFICRSIVVWRMGSNPSRNGINSFYLRCSNCYCCCIIFLWKRA